MSYYRDLHPADATYRFGFHCSYMGRAEYSVYDRGGRKIGILVYRPRAASEYERSIYNGDPAELDREIGLIWWLNDCTTPFPHAIARDFYAYQVANFEAARESFGADIVPNNERPTRRNAGVYVMGIGFEPAPSPAPMRPICTGSSGYGDNADVYGV